MFAKPSTSQLLTGDGVQLKRQIANLVDQCDSEIERYLGDRWRAHSRYAVEDGNSIRIERNRRDYRLGLLLNTSGCIRFLGAGPRSCAGHRRMKSVAMLWQVPRDTGYVDERYTMARWDGEGGRLGPDD